MNIHLGNLSVREIEERLGIEFSQSEREFLTGTRQQICDAVKGEQWHCYDIPFLIHCGSMEFARKVRDLLLPYGKRMKTQVQIGVKLEELEGKEE